MGNFPHTPASKPVGKYVYVIHVDGIARYVGAGSGSRAWSHFNLAKQGSQTPFHRYLSRLSGSESVAVKIVKDRMSENDAHVLERALIDRFGRKAFGNGSLFNLGDGSRYNGQRMHTARAFYLRGEPSPFSGKGKRRRPVKSVRIAQEIAFRAKFGANA